MMLRRLCCIVFAVLCIPVAAHTEALESAPVPEGQRPLVMQVEMHDTLQPQRADLLVESLAKAQQQNLSAVILDFSSPGGLVDSTDRMVDAIRRSRVPVIVWAGAGSSRISGQGLRLMAAADMTLMTPSTYLTPLWSEVPRGVTAQQRFEGSRRLNQSLTGLLKEHGRNASAVEELSSGSHWFTASEALQAGFIDGIAEKQPDVLRWLTANGYRRNGVHHTLDLTGVHVVLDEPGAGSALLVAMMNPNLCVLLCTLGLLLIYLEINTPGVILPGAAGVLLVLLAAYSLSRLPLNRYGILLCALAVILLALEAQFKVRGLLAGAGIVAVMAGLGILVQGPLPQLQVHWSTAVGAGMGFGGITASLMLLGMEARRAKIRTGADAMLGWLGVAHTALAPDGHVLVRGELWRARLTSNDSTVAAGGHIKVLRADGLILEVTALPLATSS